MRTAPIYSVVEGGTITVRQMSWFASGVGYVKQETETRLGDRMLTHTVLTLEKYEPAPGAQPAADRGR